MPERVTEIKCPGEKILSEQVEATKRARGWNCSNESAREAKDAYNVKAKAVYDKLVRDAQRNYKCAGNCKKTIIPVHLWDPDKVVTTYEPSKTSSNLDKAESTATGIVSIKIICK